MRWGRGTEIGFVGRLGVSLLALYLLGGLWSDDVLGLALGVVGAALLAVVDGRRLRGVAGRKVRGVVVC
jgi:hypothetical protein